MDKSKFTPGPWVIFNDGKKLFVTAESAIPVFPREIIAETASMTDARLIAAAPDLLEACQEAAEYLATLENTKNMIGPEYGIWHRIKARVDKATEVQP